VGWLRFAGGGTFEVPEITWQRVNEAGSGPPQPETVFDVSFAAPPFPNPARDRAVFRLGLAPRDAGPAARVRIHDLAGRTVRTLVDGSAPGVSDLLWNLDDDSGRRVPAGLYFMRVDAGSLHAIHRVIVVR